MNTFLSLPWHPDSIPHEVDIIPELIKRISLDSGNSEWLKAINESSKDYNRTHTYKRVKDCGYDIEETAKKLESFYLSLYYKLVEIGMSEDYCN